MKLSKKHWLVYNYNYVFDKPVHNLNKNFCDLFWGGFVLWAILIPFTLPSYIVGLTLNKGIGFKRDEEPISTNIARILLSAFVYGMITMLVINMERKGVFLGGVVPVLITVGTLIIFFLLIAVTYHIRENLRVRQLTKEEKESKPKCDCGMV